MNTILNMKKNKILVTGGNGFVGSDLISILVNYGYYVVAPIRNLDKFKKRIPGVEYININGIDRGQDWTSSLDGVDVVIHCAARVHVMKEKSIDPIYEYRETNVNGLEKLVSDSIKSGVSRFILLSSIKVNGELTLNNLPFNEESTPNPIDNYGVSKYEAEELLKCKCASSEMDYVILRPPLIYGRYVKANFLKMVNVIELGVPLPFKRINNKRSFISLDNLNDIICLCIEHERAKNETFLVSDGEDVSIGELLRKIGDAVGKPARLYSLPEYILRFIAKLSGNSNVVSRLIDSLQVDNRKIVSYLGWTQKYSMNESLVKYFNRGSNEKSI